MALPEDIAALAEKIVNTLSHTVYQHVDKIDPASGVYDCDCNGFVAHLLRIHGAAESGGNPDRYAAAGTFGIETPRL